VRAAASNLQLAISFAMSVLPTFTNIQPETIFSIDHSFNLVVLIRDHPRKSAARFG